MADGDKLQLTLDETVTIVSSTPEALTVEATYQHSSHPPPLHSHPMQDEHFEVLAGTLNVRYGGERGELGPGDTLEIPEGMAHRMWNASEAPATVRWTTTPRGRTEEWFRAIDALVQESAPADPSALGFAVLLSNFGDTFRLAVAPYLLTLPVLKVLGGVGHLMGHRVGGKD